MRCADQALTCKAFVKLDPIIGMRFATRLLRIGTEELRKGLVALERPDSTLSSEEWSRRVREGVKALPKLGPVVTCQGDWE